MKSKVDVFARFCPLRNQEPCDTCSLSIPEKRVSMEDKKFNFDEVFDDQTSQAEVYEQCVRKKVEGCLEDGQTGNGKSFTIFGRNNGQVEEDEGIIQRALRQVFTTLSNQPGKVASVAVALLEIYNEEITDHLHPEISHRDIALREDRTKGIYLTGAREEVVSDFQSAVDLLRQGLKNRGIESTRMSRTFSRSHTIFSISIELLECADDGVQFTPIKARLHLVDLAGSERIMKSGASGAALKEACQINKSLTTLSNVLCALSGRAKFVPYRDSKLTRYLQDSLREVVMIACLSAAEYRRDETLSTLRCASRWRAAPGGLSAPISTVAGGGESAAEASAVAGSVDSVAAADAVAKNAPIEVEV